MVMELLGTLSCVVYSTRDITNTHARIIAFMPTHALAYHTPTTHNRHNAHNTFTLLLTRCNILGSNLSELRRKQTNQKFSMLTTCKLGVQMLRAIQSVHELGFLHRDIKPV